MGARISKCCKCKSKQKENENGVEAIVPRIHMYEETKNDEVSDTLGEPNLDFSFQLERELDFHFNSIRSSSPHVKNELVLPNAFEEPRDPTLEDSGSFYDAQEYVQEDINTKSSDVEETRGLGYKEIDQPSNSEDDTKYLESTDKYVTEQIVTKNPNALDSELTDEERGFSLVLDIDQSKPEATSEKQVAPLPNPTVVSTDFSTAFSDQTLLDQNVKSSTSDSGEDDHILVPSCREDINGEPWIFPQQVLHADENDLQKETRTSADTESVKSLKDRNEDQSDLPEVSNHETEDLKLNNATITELKGIIESINILETEMENVDKQDTYQTLIKIMMQVNQVKNEDFDVEILDMQNSALNQINRCLRILK